MKHKSDLRSDIEKATESTGQRYVKGKPGKPVKAQDKGRDAGERTKGMGGS